MFDCETHLFLVCLWANETMTFAVSSTSILGKEHVIFKRRFTENQLGGEATRVPKDISLGDPEQLKHSSFRL